MQDGRLRIAVKRCTGGVFSTFANEALKAGDALEVMPPLGHFGVPADAAAARHYVAFVAGSGITPILSIVKTTLAAEPRAQFTLFYGNRASASVMFRDELAALKDTYLTRFNLVHVLSREAQDIDLLHGRIDADRAGALLDHWAPLADVDVVFLCGPDADDAGDPGDARGARLPAGEGPRRALREQHPAGTSTSRRRSFPGARPRRRSP